MKHRDGIKDICDEFKVDRRFVNFVWAVLQGKRPDLEPMLPRLGAFVPRTKRECALACALALRISPPPPPGQLVQ